MLGELLLRPCQLLVDSCALQLGAAQLFSPCARPSRVLVDALHASAVLAHQPLDLGQALLDRLERAGARIAVLPRLAGERVAVGAQFGREVVGLEREHLEPLAERVETPVTTGNGTQTAKRPGHERERARALLGVGRKGGLGGSGRLPQRLEAAQSLARCEQPLVLALAQRERIDLGQLVLEQRKLALARIGHLAQSRMALSERAKLGMGLGARAQPQRVRVSAQLIEQRHLRRCDREAAMLVLAVEGQQHLPRLAQVADRCAAAVHVRPSSTIRAHATGEHQLARVGGQTLAERLARVWGEVEHSLDIGLGGPRTHDPGACAAAQEQVQCVREDRLAGSGLACDHVQARGEAQLRAFDQQQILDRELVQHPAISSNARRRIARHRRQPACTGSGASALQIGG